MQARALIAAASVVTSLVVGGALTEATGQASSRSTSVHLYAPFSGGGNLAAGIRVKKTARGYCWTSSSADARSDAYRCFVGNYIYDPCFASDISTGFVVCPLYTPSSKVLKIALTKRLPVNIWSSDPTRYAPWAIQLASGKWCTAFTGTTGAVAGMGVTYGCVGGGILLGKPHRAAATWTIFHAVSFKASQFQAIAIRSVWW